MTHPPISCLPVSIELISAQSMNSAAKNCVSQQYSQFLTPHELSSSSPSDSCCNVSRVLTPNRYPQVLYHKFACAEFRQCFPSTCIHLGALQVVMKDLRSHGWKLSSMMSHPLLAAAIFSRGGTLMPEVQGWLQCTQRPLLSFIKQMLSNWDQRLSWTRFAIPGCPISNRRASLIQPSSTAPPSH